MLTDRVKKFGGPPYEPPLKSTPISAILHRMILFWFSVGFAAGNCQTRFSPLTFCFTLADCMPGAYPPLPAYSMLGISQPQRNHHTSTHVSVAGTIACHLHVVCSFHN